MEVIHDDKNKRFYIGKDKVIAEMVYIRTGEKLLLEHTWVDDEHRSEGLGRILLDHVADFARKSELKITPYCPYAKKMFRDHPELYEDLLEL